MTDDARALSSPDEKILQIEVAPGRFLFYRDPYPSEVQTLTVYGKEQSVLAFKARAEVDASRPLSFDRFVPMPPELGIPDRSMGLCPQGMEPSRALEQADPEYRDAILAGMRRSNLSVHGCEDWTEWRRQAWGSSEDAFAVHVEEICVDAKFVAAYEDRHVLFPEGEALDALRGGYDVSGPISCTRYHFGGEDTALPAVLAMSRQLPDLLFHLIGEIIYGAGGQWEIFSGRHVGGWYRHQQSMAGWELYPPSLYDLHYRFSYLSYLASRGRLVGYCFCALCGEATPAESVVTAVCLRCREVLAAVEKERDEHPSVALPEGHGPAA